MLIPITEESFKENVKIRFNNITEGFSRFENKTLQGGNDEFLDEEMCEFLTEAFMLNGSENSYVDFYYNILADDDKKRFIELLTEEDKIFFRDFEKQCFNEGIYYRLSKESIAFINRLNCREILFCSIYFTRFPCTIWGNYNKKFPVLYLDKNILEKYNDIAKRCNIIIE